MILCCMYGRSQQLLLYARSRHLHTGIFGLGYVCLNFSVISSRRYRLKVYIACNELKKHCLLNTTNITVHSTSYLNTSATASKLGPCWRAAIIWWYPPPLLSTRSNNFLCKSEGEVTLSFVALTLIFPRHSSLKCSTSFNDTCSAAPPKKRST